MRSAAVIAAAFAGLAAASPMPRNVTNLIPTGSSTKSHSVNLNVPTGTSTRSHSTRSHSVNLNVPTGTSANPGKLATSAGFRNATVTHSQAPSWTPTDTLVQPTWTATDVEEPTDTEEPTWTATATGFYVPSAPAAYTQSQKPAPTNATSFHIVGPNTPIATATSPVNIYVPTVTPVGPVKVSTGVGSWNATSSFHQVGANTPIASGTGTGSGPLNISPPTVTPAAPFPIFTSAGNGTGTLVPIQLPTDLPEPTVTATAIPQWTASSAPAHTSTKTGATKPTSTSLSNIHVAMVHQNGTVSESVEVEIDVVSKLNSIPMVSFLFVTPPPSDDDSFVGVDCDFWGPDNSTLGSLSASGPTKAPVEPPQSVGFISCQLTV